VRVLKSALRIKLKCGIFRFVGFCQGVKRIFIEVGIFLFKTGGLLLEWILIEFCIILFESPVFVFE
jgi:hypothetical protein